MKLIQKPIPISCESRQEVIPGWLFSENLAGSFHAFLVSVDIHPKGYSLAAVAQLFRNAGNIGPVGDGNTGESVPIGYNKDKSGSPVFARVKGNKELSLQKAA